MELKTGLKSPMIMKRLIILRLIGTGYILDGIEIKPTYGTPFNYLVSAKQNLCAEGVKLPDLKIVDKAIGNSTTSSPFIQRA
jgi:hypothetical protein